MKVIDSIIDAAGRYASGQMTLEEIVSAFSSLEVHQVSSKEFPEVIKMFNTLPIEYDSSKEVTITLFNGKGVMSSYITYWTEGSKRTSSVRFNELAHKYLQNVVICLRRILPELDSEYDKYRKHPSLEKALAEVKAEIKNKLKGTTIKYSEESSSEVNGKEFILSNEKIHSTIALIIGEDKDGRLRYEVVYPMGGRYNKMDLLEWSRMPKIISDIITQLE